MGDISREPLPGGRRIDGVTRKGPSELIRYEELGAEATGLDALEPAAASPKDRMSPRDRGAGEADDPEAGEGTPSRRGGEPERTDPARAFLALDPEIPLQTDAFGSDGAAQRDALAPSGTEEPREELTDGELTEAEIDADLDAPDPLGLDGEPITPAPAIAAPPIDLDATLPDEAPELTDPAEIARVALAVLLSSREPLTVLRLAEVMNSGAKAVEAGLEHLAAELRDRGMPLELLAVDGAFRVATAPAVFPYLVRLKKLKKAERLSPAALETLAVIAYRQPVIRAEIEAIRGVKAGPVLKGLLDHKLVKAVARADVPGRPLQYGTTQAFLDRFGLRTLDDLPSVQELRTLGP